MKCYFFAVCLLALASCATQGPHGPRPAPYQPTPADVTLTAAGLPSVGKLVFKGPVTIQVAGPGATQNASQADNRKAGSNQGSAATGAGAASGNASKRTAGPPLAVYLVGGLLLVLAGAGGWEWLSRRALLAWRKI